MPNLTGRGPLSNAIQITSKLNITFYLASDLLSLSCDNDVV